MITIQTDDTNDIFVDANGNLSIAQDLQAVQNVCQNACLSLQGQTPLDAEYGIPYFDVVFGAHPNLESFRQYLVALIEEVEHVRQVNNLMFDFEDGVLKYSVRIETDFGESTLNG